MDFEEFEYICFHMIVGPDKDTNRVCFGYDAGNLRACSIANKYKDMPLDKFEKAWFSLCNKKKMIRKQRLKEFTRLNSSDFSNMPLEKKLQYFDAISGYKCSTKQWDIYFTKAQDNLKACLFSIQPSKKFLLEEQRDLNHFINALIGTGLDKDIKKMDQKTSEQQKKVMSKFVHVFSKVYKIPEPELLFEKELSSLGECCSDNPNMRYYPFIKINENLVQSSEREWLNKLGILFHELIHIRQHWWPFEDKHPLFSRACNNLNNLTSNQSFNLEIYTLLPREGHAYYMQQKFEEQCNERIFDYKIKQDTLDLPTSRTLWYDYQGR
ncbi:MAG: hypothetical protein IJ660_00340 [Alphaproteobacteria bacterium]|nr:hypothetical protein [Alphaproteobacteria bacterium]